ncbi:MAG: sulfatase [Planctomycetaceae bacterium]
MTRRLLVLCALLCVVIASAAAAADKPNVLYIISDDQAWTDYGFMGHETIRTPHLDHLAAQSAVFPRAYVPTSLCRPSLATLITGLYPHQHLISGNDPVFEGKKGAQRYQSPQYLELNSQLISHIEAVPTLPRLLAADGYRSLQTGKWWEGHHSRGGFTTGMTHGDVTRGGRHGDAGLKIGREGLAEIATFLDEPGDQPWFIWYAPFLPHSPHNPPQRLLDKYTAEGKSLHVARYQAMCEWFDESCGELLKLLDERGLAENTLVIYTCDNGWIQDEASPQYAAKSKRSPYDGGVRSPLMLRWPGHIEPARYETLVSTIDIAPTILAACGQPPSKEMPGLNLLDVCRNSGACDRARIFGEIFDHDIKNVDVPGESLQFRWVIEGDWKLILPAQQDTKPELYNLANDPNETNNLSSSSPEATERLTKAINDWWTP